jgi:hypothetical protein
MLPDAGLPSGRRTIKLRFNIGDRHARVLCGKRPPNPYIFRRQLLALWTQPLLDGLELLLQYPFDVLCYTAIDRCALMLHQEQHEQVPVFSIFLSNMVERVITARI